MIPTDDKMLKLAGKIQEAFKQFYLAGGTAIMFKHRHRQSFDLDFFSEKSFSYQRLAAKVRKLYVVENEFRLEDNIDLYLCSINILKKKTQCRVYSHLIYPVVCFLAEFLSETPVFWRRV